SYPLTKWRLLRRMERAAGDPVVVFCMSKTASSAIVRAVRDAVERPVYKVHLLRPESVARAEAVYRRTDRGARPRHVFQAAHLLRHLPTPDQPWDVVTIVREPIVRAASDFFQSGERLGRLGDVASTTESFERFAEREGIPRTTDWFERELLPTLGIDVYEHPFDVDRGYAVMETPAVRLLVLRQEGLDVAPRALTAFLGLADDLAIDAENVGAAKEYSDLYAAVLRDARFSEAALDLAYGSRYAAHFYSPAERLDLRRRWGAEQR
ncbi:MAG: putative capsular polysaccharide synthesis family protein, partial [Acidimicrobiales bacterium]